MDASNIPQSKADRDALFAKLFAGVQPAEKKSETLLMLLKPFRAQLVQKRREGYSLRQIAEQLRTGPLAWNASPSTIKTVIAGPAAKRRAKMKKLAAKRAAGLGTARPPVSGVAAAS